MGFEFDQLSELIKDKKPKMSWDDLLTLCENEVSQRKSSAQRAARQKKSERTEKP